MSHVYHSIKGLNLGQIKFVWRRFTLKEIKRASFKPSVVMGVPASFSTWWADMGICFELASLSVIHGPARSGKS